MKGEQFMEKEIDVCKCGHVGGKSASLIGIQEHEPSNGIAEGHGKCKEKGCECVKFTWVGFTTLSKLANA